MIRVVCQIITRIRMAKHDQPVPVQRKPRQKPGELLWRAPKLAGPHGVRPDGARMHAAHPNTEQFCGRLAQGAGLLHRGFVEVDVGVISSNLFHSRTLARKS